MADEQKDAVADDQTADAYLPLPEKQVGPYVRALTAGLNALAPNRDFVPLRESLNHLKALDPATSGTLLWPAEVDVRSGLPSFPWMERAIAEQALARQGEGYTRLSDQEVARALRLDAALGARMHHRRLLHHHLREEALLPISRLEVALKRLGRSTDFVLRFDRMTPGGAWMRVCAELSGRAGWERYGPIRRGADGRAVADRGLQHLLSRHIGTPLMALRAQLNQVSGAEVTRLSRTFVGPFWFPGLPMPDAAPESLHKGLLLHLSAEVVARDVRQSGHRDPWLPPAVGEIVPDDYGLYRERRFAASPNLMTPLRDWAAQKGVDVIAAPLVPRAG
ncbi:MAG: hypothetical protein AAFV53_00640 [Myxococcota bacterium]